MATADWTAPAARCLGALVFAAKHPTTTSHDDDLFLMLMSSRAEKVSFILPEAKLHGRWRVLFDTARLDEEDQGRIYQSRKSYSMMARSFVLLHDH
jgi:hypothetical protein